MARIQVLPLPIEKIGDAERTPFILIIDEADDPEPYTNDTMTHLRLQTGAAAIWLHAGTFDVAAPLELTEEQRDLLLTFLTP